jgi:dihydrofolate reductase
MRKYPRFNVILASDTSGGFSLDNKLPWKFMKDTNFYNTITSSNATQSKNILIMGRKTWESMNCIVPKNRISFVITSKYNEYNIKYEKQYLNSEYHNSKKLYFFPSFEEALSKAYYFKTSIVWAIGGYQIYDEALNHDHCASIYYTSILGKFETDKKIHLNSYNIKWSNVHMETDLNLYDNLNYILYFKKGFIERY